MFESEYEPFEVWRATKTDNFSDTTWKKILTVRGLLMPVSSGEEFLNDQPSEKYSDVLTLALSDKGKIIANDGLISTSGRQMLVVGAPEEWTHMMPHVVVNLKSSQFLVNE